MVEHYFSRLSRQRIVTAQNFFRAAHGPRLDFPTVKSAARGCWPEILSRTNIPTEAPRDQHGPCPGCEGVDRLDLASERIATGMTGAYAHEVMP